MNILISCAGRQELLIHAFIEALGGTGKVFASDCDVKARSLKAADQGLVAPPYTHPDYLAWVVDLCVTHHIDLIVSLNVDDLYFLEGARPELSKAGAQLIGGPIESIEKTRDKYQLMSLCEALEIPVIPGVLNNGPEEIERLRFPLIMKPRFGKGSRGVSVFKNKESLRQKEIDFNGEYIFQEMIEGTEFGLDIVNDFQGNFAGVLVRRKFEMKNGETYKAVTQPPEKWHEFAKKISGALRHQGTIDADIMCAGDEPYLIDINFRFGGGYAFSHLAMRREQAPEDESDCPNR